MKYYNENAEIFFQNTIDVDVSELYKKFETYLSSGDEIIDIGCGSGRDSKYFKERGYIVTATDISVELGKLAEKVIGQEVLNEDVLNMSVKDKYKGVWACASLLHIGKDKIEKAFENIYNSMKDGGVLYCSFKYGEGETLKDSRMFNNYTEESIKELIGKTKFQIKEIWITGDARVGRESEKWINLLVGKGH